MGKVKAYYQQEQEHLERQELEQVNPCYMTKEEKEDQMMVADLDADERVRYSDIPYNRLSHKDLDNYAKEVEIVKNRENSRNLRGWTHLPPKDRPSPKGIR